jgi:hypothetical protein
MKIVSWPTGVNRIVTTESNGTLAENGVESDKSENGSEMLRLKGSGVPDKYTVSMTFSNSTLDAFYRDHTDAGGKHVTEWQAWETWFKYVAMNGVNAFYFPDITAPQDGRAAVYQFSASGLPRWNPQGEYVKVSMTWNRIVNEFMTIPDSESDADCIDISPGMIDLCLTEPPSAPPALSDFYNEQGVSLVSYSVDSGATFSPLSIERVDYDGFKTVTLYYDAKYTGESLDGKYYVIRVPYGGITVAGEFLGGES